MDKNILILVTLSIISMSSKCVKEIDKEDAIIIENKLNQSVYVYPSRSYPDTTLNDISTSILQHNPMYSISSNDSSYIGTYSFLNEKYWKSFVASDTILIFVLNKDSVDKESWEHFKYGNKYLRKYKLSYQDIINKNRKIIID